MDHLYNCCLTISTEDLRIERRQLEDEGKNLETWLPEWEQLMALTPEELAAHDGQARAERLFDASLQLPDGCLVEPSDLDTILAQRPEGPRHFAALAESATRDHIAGAWLGRVAGCLLGKPVEGIQRTAVWPFLQATGQWPLSDYIQFTQPESIANAHEWTISRREYDTMPHMPQDDDTNYTTLGVKTVDTYGSAFTPCDVGQMWLTCLPLLSTCTAERVAYRNMAHNLNPPTSAIHHNPYREWIGAQIRADGFAYTALGNPEKAAAFAWRDASVSHIKNGIYGEMFVAAMIAAAPFAASIPELIQIGLSEIPANCRLATAIKDILTGYTSGVGYDAAIEQIHAHWTESTGYDWCHTISNAMIVVIALLHGEEDMGKSLCRAVQAGFDTDCNGATVGSILGMRIGAKNVPAQWTDRFRDTLQTGLMGMPTVKVSEMAAWTYEVYRKVLES